MGKITLEQQIRVAKYTMKTADDNGAGYKTSDKELGLMISETLATFVSATSKNRVEALVDSLIKVYKVIPPDVRVWTYLCMNANWLSWGWHAEKETGLSQAWADAWYKLNDYSIKTLKGDQLAEYLKKTD